MSDTHPPRRTEALLAALGANAPLTDDVLGDLTEEYVERLGWQTRWEARCWYYRQAITIAPLLLRDWRRNAARDEYAAVAVGVLWSTLAVQVLTSGLIMVIDRATFAITGVPFGTWMRHFVGVESPLAWMIGWSVTAVLSCAGGFIAARFGKRAPAPTVLASIATWSILYFALGGRFALRAGPLAGLASFIALALAGGLLGIPARDRAAPASAEPSLMDLT